MVIFIICHTPGLSAHPIVHTPTYTNILGAHLCVYSSGNSGVGMAKFQQVFLKTFFFFLRTTEMCVKLRFWNEGKHKKMVHIL